MRSLNRSDLPSYQFWGLLVTLVGLFLMGGSARADVQSLAILNPAMIICTGAALLTLKQEHWSENRWLVAAFVVVFVLVAVYFSPLPHSLENISPGAVNVASIRAIAEVPGRPPLLAISPVGVSQTFFFLFAPLAVFLFAIQLKRDDLLLTLPMMIALGSLSGVIGLLQVIGSADGPFYFYRITNNGSAVGLFANRNHAAVLLACLFPMLAVFAARSLATNRGGTNMRQLVAVAIAIMLIPLILVTGARSGILASIVGLAGGVLLYSSYGRTPSGAEKSKARVTIAAVSALLCMVLATIYFSRAEAIDRIFAVSSVADVRTDFWIAGLKLFWHYYPLGFGPGSFVPAFQNEEPLALLNRPYLNRLHNDWLEVGLTFGVPGVVLMMSGLIYFVLRSFRLWFRMDGARSAVAIGRMASIIILILGIASISDYPLRTPAMMGFTALTTLWFVLARRELSATDNQN